MEADHNDAHSPEQEGEAQGHTQTMVEDREQQAANHTAEDGDTNESQKKYQDLYDQYVRLAADFDNFRKRHNQEMESVRRYSTENTLSELIPVLDNLERALSGLSETSEPKMLYQSIRMMKNQLLDALGGLGMKKMETLGQPFDPNFHEAVSQVETTEFPDQTVANELQSGFMLHDRVLRPAMVAVANNPNGEVCDPSGDNPFKQAGEKSSFQPNKDAK